MTDESLQQEQLPAAMAEALKQAFSDFQLKAEKLSTAYAAMQRDFKKVNLELDQKNAALGESLARQEETQTYLNSILESMNNGVVGVDNVGIITKFNKAAADITGHRCEHALGSHYTELFSPEQNSGRGLLQVLKEGKGYAWDEKVIWHKDEYPVPVSFQTALLKDQNNRTIGAVEIFSDISRIKALEKEMQQARTMAILGEMSATVAHELRNPLGAMGVWAGLLERDFSADDPRRSTLKKIIDGLNRLNRIVSNLLVYTRPVKARMRPAPLMHIVNETINYIETEIERLAQKITVQKLWKKELGVQVLADPEKLQQAIMNICLNSIQAMPDGGTLAFGIDEEPRGTEGYFCFSIVDTGIGIEKENIERIFDPFHTTKVNGTGLGLAIVKKFIEHHNGYINVRSTVNRGTVFSIFLPRIKDER
jgi:PAS domain S-box-containing protein